MFRFLGHCLRGRMKLRKSSNTSKTRTRTEKPDEQHDDAEKDKSEDDQQHKTNSVPFLQDPAANDPEDEPPQPQGRPQRTARYQGNYQGMTAAAAIFDKEDVIKSSWKELRVELERSPTISTNCPWTSELWDTLIRIQRLLKKHYMVPMPRSGKKHWTTRSISFKSLEPGSWRTYQLVKQPYHAAKS